MATSITQAKSLLTAAELELFDQSRAEPVKTLTLKQLASKEKRTRILREKYRDLYRRQTAAQKGKASGEKGGAGAKGSAVSNGAGEANARTQRKAEIMQEMLDRFEARSAQLESRAQKDSEQKPGKSASKGAGRETTGASAGKPSVSAKRAAPVKAALVGKAKPSPKAKTPAKPVAQGTPVKAVKASSNGSAQGMAKRKPGKTEAPLSAINDLQGGSSAAVHVEHLTGEDPTERSDKAPSNRAPTHGGKAQAPEMHAPIDMVPSAERANPVRSRPGNIAIQGHVSSSIRRAQGKKDSR